MKRMYDEKEIQEMIDDGIEHSSFISTELNKKASLTGATFTGGITAPSGTFTELNGQSNPSVKPIYWHGIQAYNSPTSVIYFHILNNSSTPLDTISALMTYLRNMSEWGAVLIQCHGLLEYNSELRHVLGMYKKGGGSTDFQFVLETATGYEIIDVPDLSTYFSTVGDYVNKIN